MDKKQVIRIVALIAFALSLVWLNEVLVPFVIAFILFYLLNPLVNLLALPRPKGLGLNRTLAIILSFLVFIAAIILLSSITLPILANQFKELSENIPRSIEQTKQLVGSIEKWYQGAQLPPQVQTIIYNSLEDIMKMIINFSKETTSYLLGILSQYIKLIVIPIISFYLLKDYQSIFKGFINLFPSQHQKIVKNTLLEINTMLKNYFKAVFLLCLLVGLMCSIGLFFLKVEYFLLLGLIAAITEFIPVIGPFIGAVPAVTIGLLSSPATALNVAILYLAIQSLENSILVPRIFGQKLKLHPVSVIIGLLVLSKLIGLWGLFFAAPIMATLKIIYQQLKA